MSPAHKYVWCPASCFCFMEWTAIKISWWICYNRLNEWLMLDGNYIWWWWRQWNCTRQAFLKHVVYFKVCTQHFTVCLTDLSWYHDNTNFADKKHMVGKLTFSFQQLSQLNYYEINSQLCKWQHLSTKTSNNLDMIKMLPSQRFQLEVYMMRATAWWTFWCHINGRTRINSIQLGWIQHIMQHTSGYNQHVGYSIYIISKSW